MVRGRVICRVYNPKRLIAPFDPQWPHSFSSKNNSRPLYKRLVVPAATAIRSVYRNTSRRAVFPDESLSIMQSHQSSNATQRPSESFPRESTREQANLFWRSQITRHFLDH